MTMSWRKIKSFNNFICLTFILLSSFLLLKMMMMMMIIVDSGGCGGDDDNAVAVDFEYFSSFIITFDFDCAIQKKLHKKREMWNNVT